MTHELHVHEIELRMQNEALRELNEELLIARERYRALFEGAPVAYLVLDRDSSIVDANVAACALLQERREVVVGRRLSGMDAPPHVEVFNLHLRSVLRNDEMQTQELSLSRRGSTPREVRLDSVRDPLEPELWRAALVDLTDARRVERQLERARRLEAIGTFTSGIAHDFSGLLAVVASGADLALEQCQVGGDPLVPIQRVKRAATQGKEMVRQLLRFAAGPSADDRGAGLNIDAAIRGALPSLQLLLSPHIVLELDLSAPDAQVSLETGGPEEILRNLASNAEHAMPKGGKLRIATAIVASPAGGNRLEPARAHVVLSVSDDGVGMDAATQGRVFEPFFTTKPTGHGTGLGLAMVYGIVKRAGGHIELSSEPQRGTTFRIHLPLSSK